MTEPITSMKLEHDHSHRCYLFDLLIQNGSTVFKVKADDKGMTATNEAGLEVVKIERLACSLTNLQVCLMLIGIEPKTFFGLGSTKH